MAMSIVGTFPFFWNVQVISQVNTQQIKWTDIHHII